MNKKQKIGLIVGLSVGAPALIGTSIGVTYVVTKNNIKPGEPVEAVINFKGIPDMVSYFDGDKINPDDFLVTKTINGVETDITKECTFSPSLDTELHRSQLGDKKEVTISDMNPKSWTTPTKGFLLWNEHINKKLKW